jgi:hypothetical protein
MHAVLLFVAGYLLYVIVFTWAGCLKVATAGDGLLVVHGCTVDAVRAPKSLYCAWEVVVLSFSDSQTPKDAALFMSCALGRR